MTKEKVLITGASGSLAKRLVEFLPSDQFDLVYLTTNKNKVNNTDVFYWNIDQNEIDTKAIEGCHHIVHLAGFSIIKPWTSRNKQLMYDSRVSAANLIFKKCKEHNISPLSVVSASAMGYYGHVFDSYCKETDTAGQGWLCDMSVDWEHAAEQFRQLGSRVVQMRISLLLSKNSGILQPTSLSMRLGVGVVFGKGNRPFEWIHIDDVANFICHALNTESVSGPYNMASPQKFTQFEFMKALKDRIAQYAILIKLPKWALSIIFGDRSEILEGGCGLSSNKLMATNFKLNFPTLESVVNKEFYGKI